jgi:Holliday junction resolvase RusA-like endonuclease
VSWSLFVPGEPRSTQTGKVFRLPNGRPIVKRMHTEWSNRIALAAQAEKPPALFNGPLRVRMTFWRSRPVSCPKRIVYPIQRPDLGNLSKGLLDALEGIVYTTDAQVIELVERKLFATTQPGVLIEVEPLASPNGGD